MEERRMKKTVYAKPFTEVIAVNDNALMETWSIGVDNDHTIGPGDEDDIGAKKGWFIDEPENNLKNYNPWED